MKSVRIAFNFWHDSNKADLAKYSTRLGGHLRRENPQIKMQLETIKGDNCDVSSSSSTCINLTVFLSEECEEKRIFRQSPFRQWQFKVVSHICTSTLLSLESCHEPGNLEKGLVLMNCHRISYFVKSGTITKEWRESSESLWLRYQQNTQQSPNPFNSYFFNKSSNLYLTHLTVQCFSILKWLSPPANFHL